MANENRYYKTPFAESGNKTEVPNVSVSGAVGYDTGFGPDYELPQGSVNRKRIERDMYNGVLNGVTKNIKQWQEELYPTWIEDDGTGVAYSYPVGMVVAHAAQNWLSLEAANQEEPGTGSKWIVRVSDISDLSKTMNFGLVSSYKSFLGALPVGKVVYILERNAYFTVIAGTGAATTFDIIASDQVAKSIELNDKTKSTPKMWGAVGNDGTDDDFPALEAYMQFMFDAGSANEIILATANLDGGANYGINGRLHLLNINVNGNGAQFTPLNATSGLRISGTRMTQRDFRCHYLTQQSATTAEAIIYGDTARQCSKNVFIEINTRDAYRGAVAKPSNLTLFGNVWINCRCDNSWDWQWHLDMKQGSTSNTFINCHARGFLAAGGSPKGFYGANSTEFNFIGNFAVDQVRDGEAFQITNCQVLNIDILGLESCEIVSPLGYMARFAAQTVNIGVISAKVNLYQPGAGSEAYLVQIDGTTVNATINHVDNNQEQSGRTGDFYKIRNNNATKLKTLTVDLDDIQTGGNYQNVINLGDAEGYANSFASLPVSSGARKEFINRNPTPGEAARWVDDGAALQISSVIQGGEVVTATSAQFADVSHAVNTSGKWTGKIVANTTTGLSMQATGVNAVNTWQPSDGGAVTSPS